jgi:hypothetical protein
MPMRFEFDSINRAMSRPLCVKLVTARRPADLSPPVRGAIATLLMALALSACATRNQGDSQQVRLAPGDLVRVIDQEPGAPPNAHPVSWRPEQFVAALSSIRFDAPQVKRSEAGGRQLFTDEDLRLSSVALAEAFARAGRREDVALRLAQLRSTDVLEALRESHITAARMFYDGDRLNVVLGKIDEKPEHSFATSGTPTPKIDYSVSDSARFYADEIGSRNSVSVAVWSPRLTEGIAMRDAEERNDWLEVDMDAFTATDRAHDAVSSAVVPTGSGGPESDPLLETRLRELRDLHEEGLISDELYEEKTRELVDSRFDQ